MQFTIAHTNMNVMDLGKSVAFYKEALGMTEVRRKEATDGSFVLAFLTDPDGRYQIELTWLRGRTEPYDLSDNEIHIAFAADDMDAAHKKHEEMGVIAMDNPDMGIYFIEDPDGYWLEIVPDKRKIQRKPDPQSI